jgi:hypothetical protein
VPIPFAHIGFHLMFPRHRLLPCVSCLYRMTPPPSPYPVSFLTFFLFSQTLVTLHCLGIGMAFVLMYPVSDFNGRSLSSIVVSVFHEWASSHD